MAISEQDRARLAELGEARVRLQVTTTGFGDPFHSSALQWLAELDEAAPARSDASQAAQMRTALSASRAARIAAIAAIVTAVIATAFLTFPFFMRRVSPYVLAGSGRFFI
jgi:CHASE3 domain sensor protein